MKQLLKNNDLILMEGAIVESLRRSTNIELHPVLVNALGGCCGTNEDHLKYIAG
jgi:methionine synthase I (cobalamin-dependent)